MRFIDKLNEEKMTLAVSLPRNDYKLAKEMWENGADAIKVHINVHHHASQTEFLTFEEEKEVLNKIIADSPVPVGVVVGGDLESVRNDFPNITKAGFDFLSLYLHHAPLELKTSNKTTKMFAGSYEYSLADICSFKEAGAEIFESSIIHPDEYGLPLSMKDFMLYKKIKENVDLPMVIPTQKKITTNDLTYLTEIGVNGLLLGAVVIGKEIETMKKELARFRERIDKL